MLTSSLPSYGSALPPCYVAVVFGEDFHPPRSFHLFFFSRRPSAPFESFETSSTLSLLPLPLLLPSFPLTSFLLYVAPFLYRILLLLLFLLRLVVLSKPHPLWPPPALPRGHEPLLANDVRSLARRQVQNQPLRSRLDHRHRSSRSQSGRLPLTLGGWRTDRGWRRRRRREEGWFGLAGRDSRNSSSWSLDG